MATIVVLFPTAALVGGVNGGFFGADAHPNHAHRMHMKDIRSIVRLRSISTALQRIVFATINANGTPSNPTLR